MWNQPIFLKHKEVDIEQTVYRYILPPNKIISFAYIQQFPSESVWNIYFLSNIKYHFLISFMTFSTICVNLYKEVTLNVFTS